MGIYIKRSAAYPAVIRRCGGTFEARFVDIPNCVAMGSSAIEAEERAQSALTTWAAVGQRYAWAMPAPSTVDRPSNRPDDYVTYIKLLPATELA